MECTENIHSEETNATNTTRNRYKQRSPEAHEKQTQGKKQTSVCHEMLFELRTALLPSLTIALGGQIVQNIVSDGVIISDGVAFVQCRRRDRKSCCSDDARISFSPLAERSVRLFCTRQSSPDGVPHSSDGVAPSERAHRCMLHFVVGPDGVGKGFD